MPGTMPAMNSLPIDAVGGHRIDDHHDRRRDQDAQAPAVAITPTPKLFGIALLDHGRQQDRADRHHRGRAGAGHRGEQGAGQHRRQRQAAVPVPTSAVAKRIMRRATPPWVRKLPARMKNGIAMISNFSMPVNSFSATDSIGTWVMSEEEGQHGQAERDRDRHAGEHQREQQREDDRARSWPASRRRSPGRRLAVVRMQVVVAAADRGPSSPGAWQRPPPPGLRHGRGRGAAVRRCGRSSRPPAGSGSTSGRSRAGSPDRRSTSALPGRARSGLRYAGQRARRSCAPEACRRCR